MTNIFQFPDAPRDDAAYLRQLKIDKETLRLLSRQLVPAGEKATETDPKTVRMMALAVPLMRDIPGAIEQFRVECNATTGMLAMEIRIFGSEVHFAAASAFDDGLIEIIQIWLTKFTPAEPAAALPPHDSRRASQRDRGRRLMRAALVGDNIRRWSSIERDLQDASTNELSAAARADSKGWWWEGDALEWAKARGKLRESSTETVAPPTWPGTTVHRI